MRSLAYLLEQGDAAESRRRLGFYRALSPHASVFLASDGFVCGLCGRVHRGRQEAGRCLALCLRSKQREGVVAAEPLGLEGYVCSRCNRRFARFDDALECHGRRALLDNGLASGIATPSPDDCATGTEPGRDPNDPIRRGLKPSGIGHLMGVPLKPEAAVPLEPTRPRDFSRLRQRGPCPGPVKPGAEVLLRLAGSAPGGGSRKA